MFDCKNQTKVVCIFLSPLFLLLCPHLSISLQMHMENNGFERKWFPLPSFRIILVVLLKYKSSERYEM